MIFLAVLQNESNINIQHLAVKAAWWLASKWLQWRSPFCTLPQRVYFDLF